MNEQNADQQQQPHQPQPTPSQDIGLPEQDFGKRFTETIALMKKDFDELKADLKDEMTTIKSDAKDQKTILILGFVVLAFMVSTMVIMVGSMFISAWSNVSANQAILNAHGAGQ